MSIYYSRNLLKPNTAKTQICCFHLRNRYAKHKLNVTWNGVTLARTLSFKQTRHNLLRKLTNPEWGAHPATVRTTTLALCFSTAEFACSSWGRSRHTWHVDIALNDTCRIITGCLNATPIPCFAERLPATQIAASKQMTRDTHSMANALPSTGFHPQTALLTQQKHLPPQNKMFVPHCG